MTPTRSDLGQEAGAKARFWPSGIAAVLALAVLVWMGLGWDVIARPSTYKGRNNEYYSLLVHGFLKGHLYMDIVADPRLESPDPLVRDSAPAPLDSSYFKGHFYLYFGVTPAALILLPYAWITGYDLDPRMVVDLCVVAGFLFALGTWRMAASDHFPRVGWTVQVACVAALAFAAATPLLLTRAMFYEMAIASGYACVMAGCFWIYRALFGRGRAWVQLAWASLSLGLAVGCRPDLLLDLPVVAAAAFLAALWRGNADARAREGRRNAAAAIVPAACVGLGLAVYNFERFGSPFDFGFKYGMNGFIANHFRLASVTYLWPNMHWYYLTLPAIGPYFPYVFPCRAEFGPPGYETGETIHGQYPVMILAAFVAITAVFIGRRLLPGRLGAFLAALAYMFLSVFLALSSLGIRADRYMVDFQAPLVLAVVLLAGVAASRLRSRPWNAGLALLALLASAFNVFAGLEEFGALKGIRTSTYAAMETIGNVPSDWLARHGLLRYGPLELKVVFPANVTRPVGEPLLALGTPQFSDALYVNEYPPNWIEFMGEHLRYLEPRSQLIKMTPGKVYTLDVEMGAFYPPLNNRFFSRYSAFQARRLKTQIHVTMDGVEVLNKTMASYDAPPWTLEIGRNDISMSLMRMNFSGKILSFRRLPPPAPENLSSSNGLWRIKCVFPVQYPGNNYPVLSSGVTGAGTLVFVSMLADNQIRFGVDEWGLGEGSSGPLRVDPLSEHTVEIFIGTLAKRAIWPGPWHVSSQRLDASADKLRIWMDGQLVLSYDLHPPFNPLSSLIDVGANVQGFSTSPMDFDGPIRPVPYSGPELQEFLGRNLRLGP
jgi:hypothetical protein